MIGHKIFFTSEKMISVFPHFGAASQSGNVHNFRCFPWINHGFKVCRHCFSRTIYRKLNRMLLCLRNFWRWRTSQYLWKKFPQRSRMHTSANLLLRRVSQGGPCSLVPFQNCPMFPCSHTLSECFRTVIFRNNVPCSQKLANVPLFPSIFCQCSLVPQNPWETLITVRKKDNNEDYEPSFLRSLMASFER